MKTKKLLLFVMLSIFSKSYSITQSNVYEFAKGFLLLNTLKNKFENFEINNKSNNEKISNNPDFETVKNKSESLKNILTLLMVGSYTGYVYNSSPTNDNINKINASFALIGASSGVLFSQHENLVSTLIYGFCSLKLLDFFLKPN